MGDIKFAEIVCEAWNNLDYTPLESIISDDFEYISFWVLETMNGKETYLDYIRGKFSAIKSSNSIVSAKVYYQESIGKHIVVLDQNGNTAALELTIKDGKIQRMWMRPVSLIPG